MSTCNIHHEIASIAPCGHSMRLSEAGEFAAVESKESTGSTRQGLSELADVSVGFRFELFVVATEVVASLSM